MANAKSLIEQKLNEMGTDYCADCGSTNIVYADAADDYEEPTDIDDYDDSTDSYEEPYEEPEMATMPAMPVIGDSGYYWNEEKQQYSKKAMKR